MLELWQTEWCPASRRVRQRLTELGIDYITRQVPVEQATSASCSASATGTRHDPRPRHADGESLVGEDAILAHLDEHVPEPPRRRDAHRLKAEKARRRYLEEECECSQPATH